MTCRSSVNPLNDEPFERLKKIMADKARWEPLAELTEENEAEEESPEQAPEEWHSPLRESALRKILAADLSQLEPGLVPLDALNGAEEVTVGAAGRIDLLCKDSAGNVVVVELKRDNSSDFSANEKGPTHARLRAQTLRATYSILASKCRYFVLFSCVQRVGHFSLAY